MAITINQQPTNPAAAYSDLIYVVQSNLTSSNQYQYVLDIKDEDGELLTRLKQSPNPSGYGVFNIGRITSNYLDYDKVWKLTGLGGNTQGVIQGSTQSVKKFQVLFGEEYASSPTGSSTVYNGNGTIGNPAKKEDDLIVYPFIVERDSGNFNFIGTSYFLNDLTSTYWSETNVNWSLNNDLWGEFYANITNNNVILSNRPYRTISNRKKITINDYETISLLNGTWETDGSILGENIFLAATVKFYDEDGDSIFIGRTENTASLTDELWLAQNSTSNTNAGPWSNATAPFIDYPSATYEAVSGSLDTPMQLLHIGVGPRNMIDVTHAVQGNSTTYNWRNLILSDNWEYYEVKLIFKESRGTTSTGSISLFYERDDCQIENTTRFTFVNKLGVYDYFTANASGTEKGKVKRNTYDKPYINYGTTTSTIQYNSSNRGTTQYYTELDREYTAETNWLTQEEANWVSELFESPSVYIQRGDQFIPVIISNSSFDVNISKRAQKMFKYSITYTLANSRRNI